MGARGYTVGHARAVRARSRGTNTAMVEPAVTAEAFLELVRTTMPEVAGSGLTIEIPTRGEVVARLPSDDRRLRPGGTVSGPTLFMLVDLALYGVTLSIVGMQPWAVTTDISMHFLRKPPPAELVCKGRVLKAGRRLVIADALIYTAGSDEPVAHGVGTYSVPPR